MSLVQSTARRLEQKITHSIKDDAMTSAENKQLMAIRARKQSKAMTIALSPGKQLGMNALMLWMSGKSRGLSRTNKVQVVLISKYLTFPQVKISIYFPVRLRPRR